MTRYEQMAGTPERFVEIVNDMCKGIVDCSECPFILRSPCQIDDLLDWLNEPAEDEE